MVGILKRAARRVFLKFPGRKGIFNPWRFLGRVFLGNDVFVCYGRRDGSAYAEALDSLLARAGLICYFDRRGAPPGKRIPRDVLAQLVKSSVLVVLAGPEAAISHNVRHEVALFSKTNRPVIPVDFGGALSSAIWFDFVEGIDPELEPLAVLRKEPQPIPAAHVLHRIIQVEATVSRRRRLQEISLYTGVGILALLITVAGTSSWIVARAEERRVVAELAEEGSRSQAWWARRSAESARREAQIAETAANDARNDRIAALRDAGRARREALRQQGIADAVDLSNEAEALRIDFLDDLEISTQKAMEAMRRFQTLGLANAAADRTLRRSVKLLRPRVAELPFHGNYQATALALSVDGSFIALAADHLTSVRSLDTADPAVLLPLPPSCCRALAFTADSHVAAVDTDSLLLCSIWGPTAPRCEMVATNILRGTFSQDGSTFGFVGKGNGDASTSVTILKLGPHPRLSASIDLPENVTAVRALGLSEDGTSVAIGVYIEEIESDEILVFDLDAALKASRFASFRATDSGPSSTYIGTVCISRQSQTLVAAVNSLSHRAGHEAVVWDLRTRRETARFPTATGADALELGCGGRCLAVSGSGTGIRLWDLASRGETARLILDSKIGSVPQLALSNDGRRLAADALDGRVVVWSLEPEGKDSPWAPEVFWNDPALNSDGRYFSRMPRQDEIVIDDLKTRTSRTVRGRFGGLLGGRLAFNEQYLYFVGLDDKRSVLRVTDREIREIPLPRNSLGMSFSGDGTRMAVRTYSKVGIFNTGATKAQAEVSGCEVILAATLHPDGTYLAVLCDNGAKIWTVPRGAQGEPPRQIDWIKGSFSNLRQLSWSPHGDFLAFSMSNMTYLWSTTLRRVVAELQGKPVDFGFSPDGRFFGLATQDRRLHILERPFSSPAWKAGLIQGPRKIAFHPGGSFVAVALDGRATEIWDLPRRQRLTLLGSESSIRDLAFSGDDRHLVMLDDKKVVHHEIWRPEDLLREARRRLARGALLPLLK